MQIIKLGISKIQESLDRKCYGIFEIETLQIPSQLAARFFILSGFNANARWDSIFMLTQFIMKQNHRFWWFDNTDNPKSVTVRFYDENRAQACYNELKRGEYGSIVRGVKVEKFIHHHKRQNK